MQMPLICAISALRVAAPHDLRPPEARQSVLMAVQELERRFPDGFPKLDPIEVFLQDLFFATTKVRNQETILYICAPCPFGLLNY